jgi:hypothetical protein
MAKRGGEPSIDACLGDMLPDGGSIITELSFISLRYFSSAQRLTSFNGSWENRHLSRLVHSPRPV